MQNECTTCVLTRKKQQTHERDIKTRYIYFPWHLREMPALEHPECHLMGRGNVGAISWPQSSAIFTPRVGSPVS